MKPEREVGGNERGAAARAAGCPQGAPGDGFDDLFSRIFLERVEPRIGLEP
jgi:elongation factor P--beta-lysine ligase